MISGYWALGGTIGIRSVGGRFAELATSVGSGTALAAAAAVVKIAGVCFALLFAHHSGRRLPRRALVVVGWVGAWVLTGYGAVNMVGATLALTGAVDGGPDIDRYALGWHLALWDPLFLLWGLFLGLAVRRFTRNVDRR